MGGEYFIDRFDNYNFNSAEEFEHYNCKKINIIGKLQDKFFAFEDDAEIWGCNWHDDFDLLPRYDLWFDIHKEPNSKVLDNINPDKLVLRDEYIFKLAKETLQGEYINNSMCYMLFYALINGYKEVKFYGCSLNDDHEQRTKQKEALNMLIMYCRGRGMLIDSNRPDLFIKYERYVK